MIDEMACEGEVEIVVATGGFSSFIARDSKYINRVDNY